MKPPPVQMNAEKTLAFIFLAIGLFAFPVVILSYKLVYSWSRPLSARRPSGLRMLAYFGVNILFIILGFRCWLDPSKC